MLWSAALGSCAQLYIPLIFVGYISATATNRTIDNESGDSVTGKKPVFLPTGGGIWEGQGCGGCGVRPDRGLAFNGTWNAATFRPEADGSGPLSIDLEFKGTAIYVYFITGNQIDGGIITTLTECNFTLDSKHAGFFQHIPDHTAILNYNVLAFSRTGLQNVNHKLRVSVEGVQYHVFINFDYATYTFEDDSLPTASSPPNGPPRTNHPSPPDISLNINPKSSATALGITPTISGSSVIPTTNLTNTSQSPETAPKSSSVASAGAAGSDHQKVPLGTILGGTIGGVALALSLVLIFCIYYIMKKNRRLDNSSTMDWPVKIPTPFERVSPHRDPQLIPSDEHTTLGPPEYPGACDFKDRSYTSEASDKTTYGLAKGRSEFGHVETESGAGSMRLSASSAALTEDVLVNWQIDIERQIRECGQDPKDTGTKP